MSCAQPLRLASRQIARPAHELKKFSTSLSSRQNIFRTHPTRQGQTHPGPSKTTVPHLATFHSSSPPAAMASATTFYNFTPKDKKGSPYPLSQHAGKVILAVNTASKCGFTPQFAGLESLYKKIQANDKYKDDFVILGFPCNQFGGQDPGNDDSIQQFCQLNYGVTFPVLGKTDVNGSAAEPVWEWMKSEKPGIMGLKRIKWNFEKFLIGRDGKVVGRWASPSKPESLEAEIMKELEKPKPSSA